MPVKMIRTSILSALAMGAALAPIAVEAAPRSWMLPSETMFVGSGDEWLTVDAALSTDLYYFDHAVQNWEPFALAPDGSKVAVENSAKGRLRQTFDVHVVQPGTYKIAIVSESVSGSYLLNGERKMLPRGTTPATLAQAVPAGATDVWSAVNTSRIETFATAGEPTTAVFKPTGKGLEMVPVTHPTELASGEAATFQFLLDGKPAADLSGSAVNGGVRYRDGIQQLDLTTDAEGKVTITWPDAGMWWVNVASGGGRSAAGPGGSAPQASAKAEQPLAAGNLPGGEGAPRPIAPPRPRSSYSMTVEVLPS